LLAFQKINISLKKKQEYFFNDTTSRIYMNRISYFLFGKLKATDTIAIVTKKNIAAEKGFS